MKRTLSVAFLTTLLSPALARGSEGETADANGFRVFWKDSLRLETNDGRNKLRIGGQMHQDWAFSREDSRLENSGLKIEDGTEARRNRAYLSGVLDENFEFKWQMDFAGGDADYRDVYLGVIDFFGLGGIRVGQFKEPFSMEELTSSNSTIFLEHALDNAFVPSRNVGIQWHDQPTDTSTLAVGYFRDTDSFGTGQEDGNHAFTGRATLVPFENEDGSELVHLGVSASYRGLDAIRISARPEAHLAPRFVDTGSTPLAVDQALLLGGELAALFGPFSLEGEYVWADYEGGNAVPDFTYNGVHVQGTYSLTGERRSYDRKKGLLKTMRPERKFTGKSGSGPGAWELALRYSYLDLDDGLLDFGELQDLTVGLNWYLNNNARIMWNYIHADQRDIGEADILQMRLQLNF